MENIDIENEEVISNITTASYDSADTSNTSDTYDTDDTIIIDLFEPELICTHQLVKTNDFQRLIYYIQEWKKNSDMVVFSCTCPHFHHRLGPYVEYPSCGCKHIRCIYE